MAILNSATLEADLLTMYNDIINGNLKDAPIEYLIFTLLSYIAANGGGGGGGGGDASAANQATQITAANNTLSAIGAAADVSTIANSAAAGTLKAILRLIITRLEAGNTTEASILALFQDNLYASARTQTSTTLAANTATTLTVASTVKRVELQNTSSTDTVWFNINGTAAVNTGMRLAPGSSWYPAPFDRVNSNISVISTGTPTVTLLAST
jgi:hypothetical protein